MFKKIPSDPPKPPVTVWEEIHRTYKPYFDRSTARFRQALQKHPQAIFKGMVAALAISAFASVFVYRPVPRHRGSPQSIHGESPPSRPGLFDTPADGLGAIMEAGSAIRKSLELREQIDRLLQAPSMTASDSAQVAQYLSELEQLEKRTQQLKDESKR